MTDRFAGYHWTDGGSQRVGLEKVESVFATGKGWCRLRPSYMPPAMADKLRECLAYLMFRQDHYVALYYTGNIQDEERWTEVEFEPDRTLEDVQAAVEAILKLSE